PAGSSLILDASGSVTRETDWRYTRPAGTACSLRDGWKVAFVAGGPILPSSRPLPALSDWTTWEADDSKSLRAFSGTARYTVSFDTPDDATNSLSWKLELGRVCYSAHVFLNGTDLGKVIARPSEIVFPAALLRPTNNELVVEVTNLMANRLAALEKEKGDAWRPFLMVNIHYKPFDAVTWDPTPSGLIGPVRLQPLASHVPIGEQT
ncbi:MAG: glycoside hydrolase, partial [Fibrella sp.]|nr:glycoside hydrolase [Armatimonadota bacterium]